MDKSFTQIEIDFIYDNCHKMTDYEIGVKLNRSEKAILNKRKKLYLHKIGNIDIFDDFDKVRNQVNFNFKELSKHIVDLTSLLNLTNKADFNPKTLIKDGHNQTLIKRVINQRKQINNLQLIINSKNNEIKQLNQNITNLIDLLERAKKRIDTIRLTKDDVKKVLPLMVEILDNN